MKVMIKILVLVYVFIAFISCDDMNSLHEQYLERGETIYTGVIDSLKIYPGDNRVKFTWEINSDPRITETVIYWNERQNFAVVPVKRTSSGRFPMESVLDLPEGTYVFEFITKDNEGHQSLFVEQSAVIYGEKYKQTLRNRSIKTMSDISSGSMKISWYPIEDLTIQYVTVKYTDYSNGSPVEKEIRVENSEMETVLSSVRSGDILTVISTHLPTDGLDPIDALSKEYELP